MQDAENNWQFDIFGFAQATPGTTLSMLVFHLLKQCGMMQLLQMNEPKLIRFLQKVESGYDPANAYHNRYAALASVALLHLVLHPTDMLPSAQLSHYQAPRVRLQQYCTSL